MLFSSLLGADVNAMDWWSQTPLFFCVAAEWLKVTDLLLGAAGCNLEARDKDGMTVLHRSVRCSTTEIMRKLIRYESTVSGINAGSVVLSSLSLLLNIDKIWNDNDGIQALKSHRKHCCRSMIKLCNM